MKLSECTNCGSTIPLRGGHCICCHWQEGEPLSRPWWMPEEVWQVGHRSGWLPLKKKKPEPPLSGPAKVIMDAIRKATA